MYYSVKTEIDLSDLASSLEEGSAEPNETVKAELASIEHLLKKYVLEDPIASVRVGDTLLLKVYKIVPTVDWVGGDAYLELTFYTCTPEKEIAKASCQISKTDRIIVDASLDRHPEIHFVEED